MPTEFALVTDPGTDFERKRELIRPSLDNKAENAGELEQISFGLNYRPVEDAVLKMSYQYLPKSFNPNDGQRIHDSAFVISVATYF